MCKDRPHTPINPPHIHIDRYPHTHTNWHAHTISLSILLSLSYTHIHIYLCRSFSPPPLHITSSLIDADGRSIPSPFSSLPPAVPPSHPSTPCYLLTPLPLRFLSPSLHRNHTRWVFMKNGGKRMQAPEEGRKGKREEEKEGKLNPGDENRCTLASSRRRCWRSYL